MCKSRPYCAVHVKPCRAAPPQPEFKNTEKQLATLQAKAKAFNEEVQRKVALERKLLKQLRAASDSTKEVLTSPTQLKKELKAVRHERNLLGQQINLGRTEMAALQSSLKESTNASTRVIRHQQDMCKGLLEEIGEQKEFIKFQSKRCLALRKQLEAANSTQSANVAALKSQVAEGEQELAVLRQGLTEATKELKSSQYRVRQVTSERNKARQDLQKMTASRDMWRATAAAALGANIELTATNKELREALHAKRLEAKELDNELVTAKERCKTLKCGALSLDAIECKHESHPSPTRHVQKVARGDRRAKGIHQISIQALLSAPKAIGGCKLYSIGERRSAKVAGCRGGARACSAAPRPNGSDEGVEIEPV
ncbi:Hypothetical protein, putative [Bodo saltans]|uniref:Uncharacterized protein n=1 Tax=Bodo saltans TaxID=75058 RepID=A0A0S4JGN4_BODSA|nr:Hypothetical protein, putative [Bodo saltans]|eukprot:CUG89171.1 Hypothetical protein, putative [Bodo saltans]